jgi:hypothetical protein
VIGPLMAYEVLTAFLGGIGASIAGSSETAFSISASCKSAPPSTWRAWSSS